MLATHYRSILERLGGPESSWAEVAEVPPVIKVAKAEEDPAGVLSAFLIPSAHTSEEWAAAHGVPFNAQEIIDRAKREYGKFAEESTKNWRSEQRAWRHSWREQQRSWDGLL